jgi:hypothetical protein
MKNTNLNKLTGLWVNKSKDGNTYLKGKIGDTDILIFKNKFKKEAKHPDWTLFTSKNDQDFDSELQKELNHKKELKIDVSDK